MEKYTLIITEKPDAAQRIASALDSNEKPERMQANGVPYYVAHRDRRIIAVPALGHLYTIAEKRTGRNRYPVFDYEWQPRHAAEKSARYIRKWIECISKLAEKADVFVDACDYDMEGSVIGYNILKYACNDKEKISKRMKYSTLTKQDLLESYGNLLSHLDFGLIEAGLVRHEIDWLYGVNLSRALTSAAKKSSGTYTTLSTGRVQGPTLKFLVNREKTLKAFVPTPYWTMKAKIAIDGETAEASYENEIIESKIEAQNVLTACKNREGQIERIDTKQVHQMPPTPFDLGTLQGVAYSLFRYTPKYTLNTAQRLYLDALISYPRTSSQKLPPSINYEAILQNLGKEPQYTRLTAQLLSEPTLRPNEGKKDDPAHPAIYPTGNLPKKTMTNSEHNILDLIIKRFMAVFGEPATAQSVKARININGHTFFLKGTRTLKEAWQRFYRPYVRSKEFVLPSMHEGQLIEVQEIILEDRFTKPPPRYNPGSLLKKMETERIGTKTTRADILQTLQERKYVQDRMMTVTNLGFEVANILERYCPAVVSIEFTRELEERMNQIQDEAETRTIVLERATSILKSVLDNFKTNEEPIGRQLERAIREAKMKERIIGSCPNCRTGELIIVYSRRTGKRFAGCSNYFKGLCTTSSPLPQRGFIKSATRNCSRCGWPILQVRPYGRRPWTFCLNPNCTSKHRRNQVEMPNL